MPSVSKRHGIAVTTRPLSMAWARAWHILDQCLGQDRIDHSLLFAGKLVQWPFVRRVMSS